MTLGVCISLDRNLLLPVRILYTVVILYPEEKTKLYTNSMVDAPKQTIAGSINIATLGILISTLTPASVYGYFQLLAFL